MRLSAGNGGWFLVQGDELNLPGRLYMRVSQIDGADRVTELYIDGRGEPIPPSALRRIRLEVLEKWAGSPPSIGRRGVPGPDLSRLASYFSSTWGSYHGRHCDHCSAPLAGSSRVERANERAIDSWVALAWISQLPDVNIPQPPVREIAAPPDVGLPELRLDYQSGQRLTDDFLVAVGRAYDAAIARGLPPAVTLAEMVGVEKKTVQSWINKARARRLIPPASSKGRVV